MTRSPGKEADGNRAAAGPAAPATPGGGRAAQPAVALTDLAFPAASPAAEAGEAEALRKPPACITCQNFTHEPGTRLGGHDYQAPRRVGHHAYGADPNGRMVVHRPSMAGEVTADFPYRERKDGELVKPDHDGLEQALEWAQNTLASDELVHHVVIQQSVQEYHGQSWKLGRTVKIVGRDDAATAGGPGSAPGRASGQGSRGDAAAAGHRGRPAARRLPYPGGTATGRGTGP